MRLRTAILEDFRNISAASLDLSPHFTVLVGANGQGKTNALEALYLASALRPLRNVSRKALVRERAERARVELSVERASTGLTHDVAVELSGAARALEKDGKRVDASTYIGTFVGIAFTPDDLHLGKGSPEGRRKFLDRALLDLRPAYLRCALRYQKAVKDRNRVLADGGSDDLLDAFDAVIACEGAAITRSRAAYVADVAPRVCKHFEWIAHPAPTLGIRYETSLHGLAEADLENALRRQLDSRRSGDRRRKTTSIGPHHDDMVFTLDGAPIRERASQGQHRAIVLALKLSELAYSTERLGEPPVLLLDDMSSELDAERSRQLFRAVSQLEGQVVMTSTEEPSVLSALLGMSHDITVYRVASGSLTRR